MILGYTVLRGQQISKTTLILSVKRLPLSFRKSPKEKQKMNTIENETVTRIYKDELRFGLFA